GRGRERGEAPRETAYHINIRVALACWRLPRQAGRERQPRLRRRCRPEAAIAFPLAGVAEARRTHVNNARVELVDALPGEAPVREHFGAEVFHDGIALGNEAVADFEALGVPRVEADRELAVMQRVEVRIGVELLLPLHMVRLRRIGGEAAVRRETMIVPAAGALDVDHLRAVMREQPRCPR